jgi:hypothetical protein
MGIGEEVEEVQRGEAPAGRDQPARVPGEGYGIAGEIGNDFFRFNRNGSASLTFSYGRLN